MLKISLRAVAAAPVAAVRALSAVGARALSSRLLLATLLVPAGLGCNKRVFEVVDDVCGNTIPATVDIPLDRAADILIVVDNSGSMQEEQDELARTFFDADCPLTDLANIPARYQNPSDEVLQELEARCGFIQMLAAYDNDFRVGVITTTVDACDNRFHQAQRSGVENWGYRPQRGCLQPDGPPGGSAVHKVIARADLQDDDPDNDDLGARFVRTLDNIRTFGSGVERPLDAVTLFLADDATRGPGCDGDRDAFVRDDARLVVVFLTDEDDCSHGGAFPLASGSTVDEASSVCGRDETLAFPPGLCLERRGALPDPAAFLDVLKAARGDAVAVAVIAGAAPETEGGDDVDDLTPQGCSIDPLQGTPVGEATCAPSGGSSNNTASPTDLCHPARAAERNFLPCCEADGGPRLFAVAAALDAAGDGAAARVGRTVARSICQSDQRRTLMDIARLVARVDFVDLAEAPRDDGAIVVEVGGERLARVDEAACATSDGFTFEAPRRVVFCGSAVPGPGDRVAIAAPGVVDEACSP